MTSTASEVGESSTSGGGGAAAAERDDRRRVRILLDCDSLGSG